MKVAQVIENHTPDEVHSFAERLKITDEKAAYIEWMRNRYICFEHDYIKKAPDESEE